MTYIVVSSNEIVKAEMERPEDPFGYYSLRSDDGQDHNKLWVDFEKHCLSLPRIPIEGKHDWEVWQSVEKGKDFIFIERCCVEFHVLGVSECESSDDDDNPCKCSVAIPIQPTPEGEKVEENKVFGEWQLCPKCGGSGSIPSLNTTFLYNQCDVCNGAKILARPLLNNDNTQTNKNGQ